MSSGGELCGKCGAPLPSAAAATEITCTYCGFVRRADAPRVLRLAVRRRGLALVAVLTVLPVALVVVAVVVASRTPPASPAPPPATGPRALRVAELATWTDRQSHPLEPTGMPGSLAAFDPVAAAPWAIGVAQAWAPDAQLDHVSVDGVSPEGVVDTRVDELGVEYVFVSPARRDAFARMQQITDHPDVVVFFRLRAADGVLTVSQSSAGAVAGALPPAPTLTCGLARIVADARAHGLAARPQYDVALQSVQDWHGAWAWRWNVEAPTGTRLDADDYDPATCALLP